MVPRSHSCSDFVRLYCTFVCGLGKAFSMFWQLAELWRFSVRVYRPNYDDFADPLGRARRPSPPFYLPSFSHFFLSFPLPFFVSCSGPSLRTPGGPPYPPPGLQPGKIFHGRVSSEPTFFDYNLCIYFDNSLMTLCPPKAQQIDPKRFKNDFENLFRK